MMLQEEVYEFGCVYDNIAFLEVTIHLLENDGTAEGIERLRCLQRELESERADRKSTFHLLRIVTALLAKYEGEEHSPPIRKQLIWHRPVAVRASIIGGAFVLLAALAGPAVDEILREFHTNANGCPVAEDHNHNEEISERTPR